MNIGRLSIASAIGAALLLAISGEAFAGPEGYCDAYSRDAANRKARTTAGNVLTGTALGSVSAASTGVALESGETELASGGTALSGASANSKWRKAYINAYDDCMFQYGGEKVTALAAPSEDQASDDQATDDQASNDQPAEQVEEQVEEPVKKPAAKAKAKAKGKPEPGTQAWNNACDRRYRSFNPKTGNYKSLSGKTRKCQL